MSLYPERHETIVLIQKERKQAVGGVAGRSEQKIDRRIIMMMIHSKPKNQEQRPGCRKQ